MKSETSSKKNLLVLAYHRILGNDESADAGPAHVYEIREQAFGQQLDLLRAKNCHFVSLRNAAAEAVADRLNVALSFDDGYASDWNRVFPILAEKGLPATFFIAPEATDLPAVNWEKIKLLHRHGFTIGAHGLSHRALTGMTPEQRQCELLESGKIISDRLGEKTELFSFPFGRYNPTCVQEAKAAGYKHGLTTRFKTNDLNKTPEFLIHRWSVKKNTGLAQMQRVIEGNLVEKILRQTYSGSVFTLSRMTGHRFMNQLHGKIKKHR